jgi:peptidoglycan/xylan/chitin deacetylase (PgdA/CDA1 family)
MTRSQGIHFRYFHGAAHATRRDSCDERELLELIDATRPLHADEWLNRAIAGRLGSDDCCLTFDGNLRCQRDIAVPVLRRAGLRAFWFVSTGTLAGTRDHLEIDRLFEATCFNAAEKFHDAFHNALEESSNWALAGTLLEEQCFTTLDRRRRHEFVRDVILGVAQYRELMDQMFAAAGFDAIKASKNLWMTDDDIVALHRDGHVLGLHSHTGPRKLADLNEDAQREEYFENYAYLHNLLDQRPICMSHPEGSYNQITLEILGELGIQVGFGTSGGASELEYPRSAPPVPWQRYEIAA